MNQQLAGPLVAEGGRPPLIDPQDQLRRNLKIGLIAVAVLVFGLFGGAALIQITGAVIGFGEVSVESRVKRIGHPTGGVIAELYVRDGAHVKRGQPLMRLDTTVSGISASASGEGLDQLLATRARLMAERDGRAAIAYPPVLTANPTPVAAAAMAEESRLFRLRREARIGQQAQLDERVHQTQEQIASLQAQLVASRKQSKLIEPERAGVRELWDKNLVTLNRLNQLERTAVDLEGGAASLEAQIAQARARIAEI
ncbi:MAG: biotin/lipoyl-binding protein, partial [Sphingomonas sp.]